MNVEILREKFVMNGELSLWRIFFGFLTIFIMTGGGLTSNFEINSVFREDTPKYYSQLSAIYDEIKYTDSVFCPTKDYILKYGNLSKEIEKSSSIEKKVIQEGLFELKKQEQLLPGTVPSLKKIMIDFIKSQLTKGEKMVAVKELYANIPKIIREQHISMKMDTLENTIRGELNKHETESKHKDCMALFKRIEKGQYILTEKAMNYGGR
ncbi:MAG: hypothetical protein LBU65_10560 [Planctomycetaceae bacterium]|nr:hypothetical protein [Planctomycetaceae bacterium]